ncbi:unnamed protein product [Clonostachys rosea]|uniref:Nucleoside phosphorylase domain-containing protein n=1 Tax=Bionectria ochroleuca TaxID=29856 RepID=A0ABY6U3F7_BIOOC|nr:unnamed protein product [Clonostachys rosea]
MSDNVDPTEKDQAIAERQNLKADDDARHKPLTHADYTVGWVCALAKEQTAATAMLDERHHDLPKPSSDSNTYTLGCIGKHYVVIACLPKGQIGTSSAAAVATQMTRTFSSVRIGLMVGIGGGIPSKVRLGDVVVGTPSGQFSGVVQWDFGKAHEGEKFERIGSLNAPPASLGTALTKLETKYDLEGARIPEYLDKVRLKWPNLSSNYFRSEALIDPLDAIDGSHDSSWRWLAMLSIMWTTLLAYLRYLFGSSTLSVTNNATGQVGYSPKPAVGRDHRRPGEIHVHHGLIASGNQVIKDAVLRDKLDEDFGGHVYCVDMEAAGLMNNFPCVVIRGICDYADAQKNKTWQEYAALVAAAFAKELLENIQASEVQSERTANDTLGPALKILDGVRQEVISTRVKMEKKEEHDILNWLTPIDYGPQHSDILQKQQPETGRWFLDSTKYQNWVDKEKGILYCPGIPGAGKTILTAATIEDLTSRFRDNQHIGIAYIYCNFRRVDDQKAEHLLAALLKQLCRQQQSLPDSVRHLQANTLMTKRAKPTLNELAETLHLVVSMYSRVFIVIDALDECQVKDGCRIKLLSEVFKLQNKTRTNLFATSRPSPEIELNFKECDWCKISANEADIRAYLNGNMWQMLGFIQKRSGLKKAIEEEIAIAAKGMFLLARLYFDSLKDKTSAAEIKSSLQNLREVSQAKVNADEKLDLLSQAYDEAMGRINMQQHGFRQLAAKVLSWIIFARRQLTISELQQVLAVSVGDKKLDEDNVRDITDIVSVCMGLVTVDEQSGIIRLVHYTAQQYFDQTKARWFPNAEVELATICVAYISFSVFEAGDSETEEEFKDRLLSDPTYSYAAQNWGHHARFAAAPIPGIMQFLGNASLVNASAQVFLYRFRHEFKTGTKAIHIAAYFGLTEEVAKLLEEKWEVDSVDDNHCTPLCLAAENGHEDTVELLLRQGAEIDPVRPKDRRTPLIFAIEGGHEVIVKLLIENGANVEWDNFQSETPLIYAIKYGHESIVNLLIEKGADIERDSLPIRKPLFVAIECGHEAIVKLLIEKGADIEWNQFQDGTPLSFAVHAGHEAIVKLLIEKGATQNNEGERTPLSLAIIWGYKAIAELLIEKGADPEWDNFLNETPLCTAAKYGYHDIAKLLLAQGVGIDTPSSDGQTALDYALKGNHETMVEILLNNGAEFESKLYDGQALLSLAAQRGYKNIFKLLLSKGANFESRDDHGRTALTWAAKCRQLVITEHLLAIANVNVDPKDKFGRTPLSWAASSGREDICKVLLNSGANVESGNVTGRTPLSFAAEEGHQAIVELLLGIGDVNASSRDIFGRTPLHWASKNGHDKVAMDLILTGGSDPDFMDIFCSTPISIAARHDQTHLIEQLLDTGSINVASQDCFGRTPLWYARRYGNAEVEQLLLGHIEMSGALTSQHDSVVEMGWRPSPTHRECDICTMGIKCGDVYYYCEICNGGDWDKHKAEFHFLIAHSWD